MMINDISTGIDIEKNKRFEGKNPESDKKFLERIFTQNEIKYCFSKKNYAQHLCVRFCAKEAAIKALCAFKINDVNYKDIEISNLEAGLPVVNIEKHPEITARVSLSHSQEYSVASIVLIK